MILAALMPCFDASARRYRKKDAVFRVDIRQDEKLRTDFQQPLALMSCSGLRTPNVSGNMMRRMPISFKPSISWKTYSGEC